MPRAKWEHVGRFQRPRLEKPEQRAIAHILGTLDDKIELNRKMDETLEAMARAIFKAWFVDFEPVRAKMEGRWQRGQSLPGLPAHLYDLFPDRLVDSELGEIPEGWEVGKLSDLVIKVVDRVDPSPSTEAIPYVPIECIASRTILLSEWQPGINARSSLVDFKRGDILFGAMRPYFHKVCIAPFDGTTRTTAFVLRPANLEWAYAVFAISRDETIDYATAHSEGSTIPYAKWAGSLESLPVNIPPKELREYFHQRISPSVERMIGAVLESRTLAALRDILLPKLISGELRVPNAERCT